MGVGEQLLPGLGVGEMKVFGREMERLGRVEGGGAGALGERSSRRRLMVVRRLHMT